MEEPRVTVIVPVFNAARYLDEAVGSVLGQTVTDWEMIMVDDGSTDASPRLCDGYAAEDARIRVIHKPNGGLASARNAGLDEARGERVMFLDSDDRWEETMLERMLGASEGVDVVCCGLRFFPDEGPGAWVDREYSFESFSGVAERASYFFTRNCANSACTKLYRRESIRNRFDASLRHAEDQIFNLENLPQARGIRFIPDVLYHYRWTDEGTLGKRFWLDQPQISRRVWQLSRSIFAGMPEALGFFDRRYVFELSRQLYRLAHLDGMPEQQRLLVMEMYLAEPLVQERCLAEAPKTDTAAGLWRLIVRGDARGVYEMCRQQADGMLKLLWS